MIEDNGFCLEHGMFHTTDTELCDPDCRFDDPMMLGEDDHG